MRKITTLFLVLFLVNASRVSVVLAEEEVAPVVEEEEIVEEPISEDVPVEKTPAPLARSSSDTFTPFLNYAEDPMAGQKSLGVYETNLATGAATYKYPVFLPAGRNGIQPEVNLSYNNQASSADSISGYGWSLFTGGEITRTKEYGVENIYNTNEFYLNMSGVGGKLLPVNLTDSEHGGYGLQVEEAFYKYEFTSDDSWIVTDKNGTQYYFGQSADSRQDDPDDGVRIFSWMLDEIRDVNGNYVRYEYYKEGGQIYPEAIYYTGYGESSVVNDGPIEIRFQLAERDDWTKWYDKGFEVKTEYLLDAVEVLVDGDTVREYELDYTTGDNGTRAMLESIVETGTSLEGDIVVLPETSFQYSKSDGDYDFSYSSVSAGYTWNASFIDVNGDGYADQTPFESSGTYRYSYSKLGSGGTSFGGEYFEAFYTSSGYSTSPSDVGVYVDMNGDILPEFIALYDSPYVNDGCLYKNYREGFVGDYGYFCNDEERSRGSYGYRLGDANGDGLADLFTGDITDADWTLPGDSIYLNDGGYEFQDSGWDSPVGFSWGDDTYPYYAFGFDTGSRLVDINGDGLTDIMQAYKNLNHDADAIDDDPSVYVLYLNMGDGSFAVDSDYVLDDLYFDLVFAEMEYMTPAYIEGSYGGYSKELCYDDFNGDGIVDIITNGEAYIWNGIDTWTLANVPAVAPKCGGRVYSADTYAYGNADMNGDGLTDIFQSYEESLAGPRGIYFNVEGKPDLLTSISASSGAEVDITYKSALQYENPELPIAIYTVSEVNTDDGLGNESTVSYEYRDGYYYKYFDGVTGEFSGFGEVSVTDSLAETVYYFDLGCHGGATCAMGLEEGMVVGVDGDSTSYPDMGSVYVVDGDYLRRITVNVISAGFCGDVNCIGTYFAYGDSDFATHFLTGEDWDSVTDTYIYDVDYVSHALKGKPTMTEVYDNSGALYQRSVNTWSVTELGDGRYYPHLDESTEFTFDGGSSSRDSAVSYGYNTDYGLLILEAKSGEVSVSGDEICVENSYAYDESVWVFKPADSRVSDCDGNFLSKSENYYDGYSDLGDISDGFLTEEKKWLDTDDSWIFVLYEYDVYGNVVSQTDPRGYETIIGYDSGNFYPQIVTNALGQSVSFDMNYISGKPSEMIDYNGYVYTCLYDGIGRLLSMTGPSVDGSSIITHVEYEYDDSSIPRIVHEIKNDGISDGFNTYTYLDGFGRNVQMRTEAEDNYAVSDISYDDKGNVEMESLAYFGVGSSYSVADLSQPATVYTYDSVGRVVSITTLIGTTDVEYSLWTETVTDPIGNVKIYYRDAYGNLDRVDEVLVSETYSTYYGYDLLGRLSQITDALGNVRAFTWDSLGRKTSQEEGHDLSDSDYGVWDYEYDGNGNLLVESVPSGETVVYVYDEIGRVESETVSDGGTSSYFYDTGVNGVGSIASITDASGGVSYEYDALGGVISESRIIDGETYEMGFENDLVGRLVSVTYPSGNIVEYAFNDSGKVESVISGADYLITDMNYSPVGQWEDVYYGNGDVVTNVYDSDQMYLLANKNSVSATGAVFQDLTYEYDANGNVLSIIELDKNIYYDYDELNRLWSVIVYNKSEDDLLYVSSYQYDAVGNLIYKTDLGDVLYGEIGDANPYAVTSADSYIYEYDENGNVINDGVYDYIYDAKNQMLSSEPVSGGTVYEYGYDFSGNRVLKNAEDGTVTYYPNSFYEIETFSDDTIAYREYVYVDGVKVYMDESIEYPFEYQSGTSSISCVPARGCWYTQRFPSAFDSTARVAVFAQIQTENNTEDADVDIVIVGRAGFTFKIEEDSGLRRGWLDGVHPTETIAWVVFDLNEVPPNVYSQTETTVQNYAGTVNKNVSFTEPFHAGSEPIIFAQKQTDFNSNTVRANILFSNNEGFKTELREDQGNRVRGGWDVYHIMERFTWISFLPEDNPFDGTSGSADVGGIWETVTFDNPFTSTPLVFASIVSQNEADVAILDLRNITTTGFDVRVDELTNAGWDDVHADEEIRYFAVGN